MTKPGSPPVREDFGKKVKAHQRYYTSDKKQVPGATTILRVLGNGALVNWANRLGLDGIDSSKFRDEAAATGTLAHYLVERELDGGPRELDDFTPAQLTRAEYAVAAFRAWRAEHDLAPVMVEGRLVSDVHRYGGTIDLYGDVDGKPTIVDYKTSNGIFLEHKCQVAAYVKLLIEHGHRVKSARLVRLPRGMTGSFEEHVLGAEELRAYWRIFEACLVIYYTKKELKEK